MSGIEGAVTALDVYGDQFLAAGLKRGVALFDVRGVQKSVDFTRSLQTLSVDNVMRACFVGEAPLGNGPAGIAYKNKDNLYYRSTVKEAPVQIGEDNVTYRDFAWVDGEGLYAIGDMSLASWTINA